MYIQQLLTGIIYSDYIYLINPARLVVKIKSPACLDMSTFIVINFCIAKLYLLIWQYFIWHIDILWLSFEFELNWYFFLLTFFFKVKITVHLSFIENTHNSTVHNFQCTWSNHYIYIRACKTICNIFIDIPLYRYRSRMSEKYIR